MSGKDVTAWWYFITPLHKLLFQCANSSPSSKSLSQVLHLQIMLNQNNRCRTQFTLTVFKVIFQAMDTYGGVGVMLHAFLKTALHWNEWPVSSFSHFIPDTHWLWGWVGPKVDLGVVVNEYNRLLSVLHALVWAKSAIWALLSVSASVGVFLEGRQPSWPGSLLRNRGNRGNCWD
jgi:hypothetical protein